jgi:protein involved in polysaccharide export with SLBB domain
MKKLIITLLLSTSFIYSQELGLDLDESYLASLPESVREDVLKSVESRREADKPVYRRPSSMVNKNYCDDANHSGDKISIPYTTKKSSIYKESTFDNISGCIERSKRFGSNFFDVMQSSFMPINEPNFDGTYILDFGDTLEVQLIGQDNYIEELQIKRDGSINIPNIGKVSLSGLSLDKANVLISNKINEAYIGVTSFVTLTNIRDIQVLVTGNAYNPGIYTLNGNSSVLHALNMAGGIDEDGSYRFIDLIRNNEIVTTIDLYDIFIHGKSNFRQRLRSGDSLLVRPVSSLVTISGAVKRPSTFELKNNETFLDLFNYANGFHHSADKESIRIQRIEKETVSFIQIKNIDDLTLLVPLPDDILNVSAFDRKQVKISGAVKTPGTYTLSKGETLSSLIKKANGYKQDAYPFAGILNNKNTLEINKQVADRLYTDLVKKLITKGDELFASESLPFILDELKQSNISGRVMAEFDLDVLSISPDLDTKLADGDEIIIPVMTQQVYIYGEVSNTGTIRYKPNQTINDYLSKSGGLLRTADRNNVYVVHPNGEVNKLNASSFGFLNRSDDILIYPGSIIYVPRELKADINMTAAIWAPIVSSFATSITALSILDRN